MDHIMNFDTMRDIDIRTVDPATLVDIRDVKIDTTKPIQERMIEFVNQMKNPYCFRLGKVVVKVGFANTKTTMEECMEGYFRSL